jgi:hypothetical protein
VRFDLANPAGGARVVFSGQDVVAARALASGLVVVALASGTVEVLAGSGDSLGVVAQLSAQTGVPSLPSNLEVLLTAGGQLQVLVSSQGSDTIFVFAQAAGSARFLSTTGSQPAQTLQVTAVTALQVVLPPPPGSSLSAAGGTGATGTTGAPGPSAASALIGSFAFTTGQALGTSSEGAGNAAVLVPIQGNTYAAVAVLDSGAQNEEEGGARRQPWLASRHPLGDTSPLMRFVTGHEEALKDYRDSAGARLPLQGEGPAQDRWFEDLFHRQPIPPPPVPDRKEDQPQEGTAFEPLAILLAAGLLGQRENSAFSRGVGSRNGQERRRAVR